MKLNKDELEKLLRMLNLYALDVWEELTNAEQDATEYCEISKILRAINHIDTDIRKRILENSLRIEEKTKMELSKEQLISISFSLQRQLAYSKDKVDKYSEKLNHWTNINKQTAAIQKHIVKELEK